MGFQMASKEQQLRWLQEGRGQGRLHSYKPFLNVRDNKSLTERSSRVYGYKTQRTHHLFSDLELALFLALDRIQEVEDIREQIPLDLTTTLQIAEDLKIQHPIEKNVHQILTSTFFVVNNSPLKPPCCVIKAIKSAHLDQKKTIAQLELERRYWDEQQVPWFVVTEKEISPTAIENIKWLYPLNRATDDIHIFSKIDFYQSHFLQKPELTLIELSKYLDTQYSMETGASLLEIRELLAQRYFLFDISKSYRKIRGRDIEIGNIQHLEKLKNVSG